MTSLGTSPGTWPGTPFDLAGLTAIVTGANTGIGQGIAVALARAGAGIAAVGRSSMDETAGLVAETGAPFLEIRADLGSTEPLAGIVEQTVGWSGRADPDGNIHIFVSCKGGLNDGKYCNPKVDEHLNAARTTTDAEARKAEYAKAAELYLADRQRIYMYHQNWFWAMTAALEGFKPHPDGMIRLEGVSLKK